MGLFKNANNEHKFLFQFCEACTFHEAYVGQSHEMPIGMNRSRTRIEWKAHREDRSAPIRRPRRFAHRYAHTSVRPTVAPHRQDRESALLNTIKSGDRNEAT